MGSWAQLKNMPPPDENKAPATVKEKSVKKKTKEGDAKEEKGGEKKSKKNKSMKKEKAQTVRLSSSSFEVGGLTASPEAPKTIGPKKHSILGLGLPTTMHLPTVSGSSTSSTVAPVANQLSVDSGSVLSSGSSLRPVSLTLTDSHASSSSSTASVRWCHVPYFLGLSPSFSGLPATFPPVPDPFPVYSQPFPSVLPPSVVT